MTKDTVLIGVHGLPIMSGYINAAYIPDLTWSGGAFNHYERLRRGNAEVAMVRQAFASLASGQSFYAQAPEHPTSIESRATDFLNEVLGDVNAGIEDLRDTLVNTVPFFGWALWEVPLGPRRRNWRGGINGWTSKYDDGLVGVQGFEFRDHSSFDKWQTDGNGRVVGMWQRTWGAEGKQPTQPIPFANALHVNFGDPNNPEGLSPLEAAYPLDTYMRNLEIIMGIGYEPAAGHLKVTVKEEMDEAAKATVRAAARAILSAQEGNYFTAIAEKFDGEIMDVPFAAGATIQEAVRYYGLRVLQLYSMQWMAMATTANTGAYSAVLAAADMGLLAYNGMMESFARQVDQQVAKRLFNHPINEAAFAGMERRPRIKITPVDRSIPLSELAQFIFQLGETLQLTPDDLIAIRRKSGFLPVPDPELHDNQETESVMTKKVLVPANNTSAGMFELARGEQFSPIDAQLETDEAERLQQLFLVALLDQYQSAEAKEAMRSYNTVGELPTIDAIVANMSISPISGSIDTVKLFQLLLLFSQNGRDYGLKQVSRPLTPAELLVLERSLSDYATRHALSMLGIENGGTGRIGDPLQAEGLDVFSAREVARLMRQAIGLAHINGITTLAGIQAIYEELVREAVKQRAKHIVVGAIGNLFNSGMYIAVTPTAPKTKTWLRTISSRPRQIHLDQVGVTIPYDNLFPDGSFWAGELPGCKCGIMVHP